MWVKIVSFSFLLLLRNSLLNGAQASGAAAKPNPQKSIRQQLDDYATQKPNAQDLESEHLLFSEKWAQLKRIEKDLLRKGSSIIIAAIRKDKIAQLKDKLRQSEKERVEGQARIQFLDSETSNMRAERTKLINENVKNGLKAGQEISRSHNKIADLGALIAAKDALLKTLEDKVAALEAINKRQSTLLAERTKEASRLEEENAALKAATKKNK
jgi:chromosome segregation ATPase